MNLRGRIPVEPLDEERVVNVERAVVAGYAEAMARGARGGWRRWVPALALASAAAAAAALVMWQVGPRRDAPGAIAAAPVRVEATTNGSRVDLGDATVDVAPGTAFVVSRASDGVLIALESGRIELAVESRKGRAPLVVRAADIDVVVVGTRFSVARGDDVAVEVTEGVVRVKRGAKEAAVAAGQRWSAAISVAVGESAFPAVTAVAVAAGPAGDPAAPEIIKAGDVQTTADGVMPELRDRDRTAAVPDRDRGRDRDRRNGDGNGSGDGSGDGNGSGDGSGSGSGSWQSELRASHVTKPKDIGLSGAEALTEYKLMVGRPDEKAEGIYGAAYTARAMGNNADALVWLQRYRQQFTSGPHLDDVMWMTVQLRCRGDRDEACRTSARAYMDKYAGTDRAGIAFSILNSP